MLVMKIEATSEMTKQAFEEMIAEMAPKIQELLDEHEDTKTNSLFEMTNTMIGSLFEDGANMDQMRWAVKYFIVGWAAGTRFGKVEK